MTKVPGHKVAAQGGAYPAEDCPEPVCLVSRPGSRLQAAEKGGHALCECGAQSPHVWSKRERQQWHRMHKTQVAVMETRPARRRLAEERLSPVARAVVGADG